MLRLFFTGFVEWCGYMAVYLAAILVVVYLARIGDLYLGPWGSIGTLVFAVGVTGGVIRLVAGRNHDHKDVSGRSTPR